MTPKYPNIKVKLTAIDGNAFMILGACQEAAREAGLSRAEIGAFFRDAAQGDYDHLLQTVARWFSVH